jgi:alkaline phosphatase D
MQLLKHRFLFFGLLISLVATAQNSSQVISGPMLGHVELRTANVWIQLKEGIDEATVLYWPTGKSKAVSKKVIEKKAAAAFPNIFKFNIPQLEPASSYEYQVLTNKQTTVVGAGKFRTQDLWQWRKPAPDFTFITGSCAYINEPAYDRPGTPYGGDTSIFLTMARENDAAFMLWLGDNWYTREVDFNSEWGLHYRPSHDRSIAVMQPLLKAMPHYAIWDDHDYGPNNAGKSFALKETSRKVFMNNWINPSYGSNGEGIYTTFSYSDVDFFLLDDRWFRDDDDTPSTINGQPNAGKRMFGYDQMEWLKNSLRKSNGDRNIRLRVIATGSQVLNPESPSDCLRHYPFEYNELMQFLEEEKISSVIFLTGDIHHGEVIKKNRKGTYTLYDITASSITAGTTRFTGTQNDYRVVGIEKVNSYCKISVEGQGAERKLTTQFIGVNGEVLTQWSVALSELSQ